MRIRCSHGYFYFWEDSAGELSKFCSIFGFEIVPVGPNCYTFKDLQEAPDYSFVGLPYLGTPALFMYEGHPSEVMRKNKFIYDFSLGIIRPILSVLTISSISDAGNYYYSDGLIFPGSLDKLGRRITDYTAECAADAMKFRYTEVLYDQTI